MGNNISNTSSTDKPFINKLLQYLPEFYHDVKEFTQLTEIEDVELQSVAQSISRLLDEQFVLTSSERTIKRREQQLGIQADPKTESLDFRKKRIINRYSIKPPFTVRYLQEQLDQLVGRGMTIVCVDVQNFILYVTAAIDNANVFKEVQHTVQTVKPANLLYQQNTSTVDGIGLEEHISMQTVDWHYRLDGSWTLGNQPFTTLGPEVVIK